MIADEPQTWTPETAFREAYRRFIMAQPERMFTEAEIAILSAQCRPFWNDHFPWTKAGYVQATWECPGWKLGEPQLWSYSDVEEFSPWR